MGEKRFYWIKLKDTFFNQLAIKKLRKIAGGDTHVIIYLKMMLLSMNNGGKIAYECDNEEFLSNLALDIDEDEDNVSLTLAFLQKNKLVDMTNEGEAFLVDVPACLGCETAWAEKKRRYRETKAIESRQAEDKARTLSLNCPSEVRQEIDKDKEKDIDIRDKSTDVVTNVHQEQGQMSGQMSQDEKKVAYASHIRMTEENYNLLLELVNGNKVFLKEIIYDCNEWRKDHKPKSKKPNDYLFVKNWLKKELDKVPAAKTVQEEQPVMSADEKRKAYLDSLPPEIRANLDQFK